MSKMTHFPMKAALLLVFGMTGSIHLWSQKAVVGVVGLETAAQNISCDGWDAFTGRECNRDLASGFRAMLETAIFKTGKMDVMERTQIDSVINEQGIAQLGLTTSGGQLGGLVGVDYLIYGTITKFGARQSGFNVSSSKGVGTLFGGKVRKGLGSGIQTASLTTEMGVDLKVTDVATAGIQTASLTTEMGVDLKVTDVATGQIVIADHVEGEVEQGKSFHVGGIQSAESSADPFADVQRIVAASIAEAIVTYHIPIKVIQMQQDGTLILNYGNVFFSPGDRLGLFETGESFVDPDTGEVLGADETEMGIVEIIRAEPKFSRARIVGQPFDVMAGSTLKRIAPAKQAKAKGKGRGKRKRSGRRL